MFRKKCRILLWPLSAPYLIFDVLGIKEYMNGLCLELYEGHFRNGLSYILNILVRLVALFLLLLQTAYVNISNKLKEEEEKRPIVSLSFFSFCRMAKVKRTPRVDGASNS